MDCRSLFIQNTEVLCSKIQIRLKKKQKSVRKRNDYSKKNYWVRGDPLTEKDQKILEEVKSFYIENGYIPSKKEISNASVLKSRFRTWKDVLMAAGLPSIHDGEEVRKRQEAARNKRQMNITAS